MSPLLPAVPLLLLLALAAAGHDLALRLYRRPFPTQRRLLAAAAQVALLAALLGLGLQTLGVNEPTAWLPLRSSQALPAAAWLALLAYLLAGAWWRSPGLGIGLPLLLLPPVILGPLTRAASATHGLTVATALRPAVTTLGVVTLALVLLACAGLLARALERRRLGASILSGRVVVGLLGAALIARTSQLGLLAYGWTVHGQGLPPWTLQVTWLLTSWLVLLLAVAALRRGRPQAPALALLSGTLILLSLSLVAAIGARS